MPSSSLPAVRTPPPLAAAAAGHVHALSACPTPSRCRPRCLMPPPHAPAAASAAAHAPFAPARRWPVHAPSSRLLTAGADAPPFAAHAPSSSRLRCGWAWRPGPALQRLSPVSRAADTPPTPGPSQARGRQTEVPDGDRVGPGPLSLGATWARVYLGSQDLTRQRTRRSGYYASGATDHLLDGTQDVHGARRTWACWCKATVKHGGGRARLPLLQSSRLHGCRGASAAC